jgi:hypothetical protein
MTVRHLQFAHRGVTWTATMDPEKHGPSIAAEGTAPIRWILEYGGAKQITGPEYFHNEAEAETLERLKASIDAQCGGTSCKPRRPD